MPDARPLPSKLLSAALGPKIVVAMFVRSECLLGPSLSVTKADLYAAYLKWAAERKYVRPSDPAAFGRYLLFHYGDHVAPVRIRDGAERSWTYRGLALHGGY